MPGLSSVWFRPDGARWEEDIVLDRDYRDIAGGLLVAAFGAAAGLYSLAHYRLGTVTSMGPGMFPTALGVLLALGGLGIALGGATRRGYPVDARILTPVIILVSISVFALMIEPFGLIPSVFSASVIACLAELRVRPVTKLVLGTVLSALTWLIFIVGLRLTIPAFDWPF